MSKTLNSFVSDEEKMNLIYNKYTEMLSSDLQVKGKDQGFILGSKKINTIIKKTLNIESYLTIRKNNKGFSIRVNFEDVEKDNILSMFSLSIYPQSVKNMDQIEKYGRFKLLKKLISDRAEILDNYFEVFRLFKLDNYMYSTIYSSYSILYSSWRAIQFIVPITSSALLDDSIPEIQIRQHFRTKNSSSFLKKEEILTITNKFDRDTIIKQNLSKGASETFKKNVKNI